MKKYQLIFLILSLIILSSCGSAITKEQLNRVEIATDTEKALNILGKPQKTITENKKILSLLNKQKELYLEINLSPNEKNLVTNTLVQIETALNYAEDGYSLTIYLFKTKDNNGNNTIVITMKEKEEDFVIANFKELN